MSNRIRILLNCAGTTHMGLKALRVLEDLVRNPPQMAADRWLSISEWHKMGRPKFKDRRLKFDEWSSHHDVFYLVGFPVSNKPSYISLPSLGRIEMAKWLWAHIPPEIRIQSRLFVIRENRTNCWRHSLANPTRHGLESLPESQASIFVAPAIDSGPLGLSPGLAPEQATSGVALKLKTSEKSLLQSLWEASHKVPDKNPVPKKYGGPEYSSPDDVPEPEDPSSKSLALSKPYKKAQASDKAAKSKPPYKASPAGSSTAAVGQSAVEAPKVKKLAVGIWS